MERLHSLGQAAPTSQQMLSFCALATSSVLMFLPWARQMEARHLAKRRTFSKLFGDWNAAALRNIEVRIGRLNGGEPQPQQQEERTHA